MPEHHVQVLQYSVVSHRLARSALGIEDAVCEDLTCEIPQICAAVLFDDLWDSTIAKRPDDVRPCIRA